MCSRRISKRVSVDNFLKNSFILQIYGDIHLIENGDTLFEQLHVSVDLLVMKGLLFLSGAPFKSLRADFDKSFHSRASEFRFKFY